MIAEEAETADEDAIEDDVATTVEVGTDWDWRLSRGEAEDERARAPRTNAAVMATIFSLIRLGFFVTVQGTSNSAVDSFSTVWEGKRGAESSSSGDTSIYTCAGTMSYMCYM